MIIEVIQSPILVEVSGGENALYKSIEIFNSGVQGPRGVQGENGRAIATYHQAVVLSPIDILNKFISLDAIPEGDYFSFLPSGGINQRVGLDFIFDRIENKLTWLNFELENILEVGDQIDIDFFVAN